MAELLAAVLDLDAKQRSLFVAAARGEISPTRLGPPEKGASWSGVPPVPASRMVGRDSQVSEVLDRLDVGGGPARLLTLIGPPGVGKTRLAIEVSWHLTEQGVPVSFVDLTAAADRLEMRDRVALAVAGSVVVGGDRFRSAVRQLGRRSRVVVLDGLERVDGSGEEVADLLGGVPGVTLLTTSRSRLDVYGEHEYRVDPLDHRDTHNASDVSPAAELFIQRAQECGRDFGGDAHRAQAERVASLLDGIPRALEIAARRLREVSLEHLIGELETGMAALAATGPRERPDRQRTLSAAVEWSLDPLSAAAAAVLRETSAFVGDFDGSDVAAVSSLSGDDRNAALAELIDLGLLLRKPGGRLRHFGFVREVVMAGMAGEADTIRERHALHVLDMARRLGPEWWSSLDPASLAPLDRLVPDVNGALAWATDGNHHAIAGEFVTAMTGYWCLRGLFDDAEKWARRVYQADESDQRVGAAFLLGLLAGDLGRPGDPVALIEEARVRAAQSGNIRVEAECLGVQGLAAASNGDIEAALRALGASRNLYEQSAIHGGIALTEIRVGRVLLASGDLAGFLEHNLRARDRFEEVGGSFGQALATANLCEGYAIGGDARAIALGVAACEALIGLGTEWHAANTIAVLAAALSALGRYPEAATAFGLSDAWLEDLGTPPHPLSGSLVERCRGETEAALAQGFQAEWSRGAELPRSAEQVGALVVGNR